MANWSALQEQLIGKQVVKRAKHGIHFDNGDGQVLANFSGRPCHYLDGGLWKPIDTKLLVAGDGYYGCPHSPVRVHPDGHVKVDGSHYKQYTPLVSSMAGLVDNDRIVREFTGGRQYLYITETGFKQEIVLDRKPSLKLADARKLLAVKYGSLPIRYVASLLTATDANGSVYTYDNVTNLIVWLNAAVYPVVIDPDFTTTSTAGDTYLLFEAATYNYGASTYLRTYYNSQNQKILIRFDCSSVLATSTVTAAKMELYKNDALTALGASILSSYGITAANGDWIEGTKNGAVAGSGEPCWNAKAADGAGGVTTAWAGSAGLSTAGTDYVNTVLGTAAVNGADAQYTKYTMTLNADGLAVIQGWLGAVNTNYGLMLRANTWSYGFCSSEHGTESYRPLLSVTYTAAGGLHRINMNAQMSNLTGGIHG